MVDCSSYQEKLIAYIHDELPPHQARAMRRHLDECPACYAAYVQQRDAANAFAQDVRVLGTPSRGQLQSMWANIAAELDTPPHPRRDIPQWQHGLAAAVLLVLCLLPWSLSLEDIAYAGYQLGATPAVEPHVTPDGTDTRQKIAYYRQVSTADPLTPTVTSTPAVAPSPQVFTVTETEGAN